MFPFKSILTRIRIKHIVARLRRRGSIQDFLDGFFEGYSNERMLAVIEAAVSDGYVTWEAIGYSRYELEYFYRRQVHELLDMLHWSLTAKEAEHHWRFSRHVIYGMERFRRFVEQNEIVKYHDHASIASAFWRKAFALLKEEHPGATEDELNSYICAEQTSFLTMGALWA